VDVPCCSVLESALDDEEAARLATAFQALADPVRLRLLSLIAAAPAGEVCACELVGPLGRSQPTVSHHLRTLYEAGLVERERRGSWVWYRVAPGRLEALRAALAPPSGQPVRSRRGGRRPVPSPPSSRR
jgi:ArsR family transcriptional regulator